MAEIARRHGNIRGEIKSGRVRVGRKIRYGFYDPVAIASRLRDCPLPNQLGQTHLAGEYLILLYAGVSDD